MKQDIFSDRILVGRVKYRKWDEEGNVLYGHIYTVTADGGFDFIGLSVKAENGCFYVRPWDRSPRPFPEWLQELIYCEYGSNAGLRRDVEKAWKAAGRPALPELEVERV